MSMTVDDFKATTEPVVDLDNLAREIKVVEPEAPVPDGELVSGSVKQLDALLDEIVAAIKKDRAMPQVGVLSGKGFLQGFNVIADDVVKIANDHVRRAEQTREEAVAFADEIRRCGTVFCRRVEEEAVRGYQVSRILREARKVIGES
jgi:hypothetical protein